MPSQLHDSHVGYYLIDDGRSALEKNAGIALVAVDEGVQDRRSAFRCSLTCSACC